MALIDINFEWWIDEAGYRLVDAEPDKPAMRLVDGLEVPVGFLEMMGRPQCVVANGGKRRSTQPLKKFDLLYKAFASLKTPEEVLRFVEIYGYLTEGDEWGNSVPYVLQRAEWFRGWLSVSKWPRKDLAAWIGKDGKVFGRLNAELAVDTKGSLHLRIIPELLLGAIWIQLAHTLADGIKLGACLHCGQWFEAGQGGRRLDAKFCSKEHQRKYNSLKRSR